MRATLTLAAYFRGHGSPGPPGSPTDEEESLQRVTPPRLKERCASPPRASDAVSPVLTRRPQASFFATRGTRVASPTASVHMGAARSLADAGSREGHMSVRRRFVNTTTAVCLAAGGLSVAQEQEGVTSGPFQFSPLPASAACVPGGAGTFPAEQPFLLPSGFVQTVVARQGDGGTIDNWDMHTLNESGPRRRPLPLSLARGPRRTAWSASPT